MKMLDLSVFENETFDITLPDRKMIRIIKPTQRLVIELLKLKEIDNNASAKKVVAALNKITLDILNTNDEGIQYTSDYIEKNLNTQMKTALISAYSNFVTGITNQKN